MTRMVLYLVAGAVAMLAGTVASILAREFVPAAPEMAAPPPEATRLAGPSPNTDGKRDRLPVVAALPEDALTEIDRSLDAGLRQGLAVEPSLEPAIAGPVPLPKPRAVPRPPVQRTYTLLSETQIAAIRTRLQLTPAQARHWPPVEEALRSMARTLHERRQGNVAVTPPVESAAEEFEQLKTAADPLLATLRDEQKRELRLLARLIGLDAVASLI